MKALKLFIPVLIRMPAPEVQNVAHKHSESGLDTIGKIGKVGIM